MVVKHVFCVFGWWSQSEVLYFERPFRPLKALRKQYLHVDISDR